MNLCKTCGTICPFDDEHEKCDNYKPMTNENWLRSCDTEQLAEFLAGIINTNPCGYLLDCNECGLNDKCREDDYPTSKEAWCEWLKQPHTNE
jgi:hypothetical protein